MKLEAILKKRGWSDQEIEALAPMLTSPKFRADMEAEYGAVSTERDQLKDRDTKWAELRDTEWQPKVTDYETKLADARMQLAQAQERIKLAKEFGYLTPEAEAKADAAEAAAKAANGGFNPKEYVSMADATRLLDAEGDAIAMMTDLNNEYARYHPGQSLSDYEAEIDGRTVRGARALRLEAKSKRMPTERYVAEKFDFAGKREALKVKRQQDQEAAIRKDEAEKVRNEMASQFGNPNMRNASASKFPAFIPKPESGKQPWEQDKNALKSGRVERAMKVQMGGAPN